MRAILGTTALAAMALGSFAAESPWAQWRGPTFNGVSPDAKPPATWNESQNVRWKVKLAGVGSGTPIVWGDRIFLQAAIATGKKVEAPAEEAKPAAFVTPAPAVFAQAAPPPAGGGDGQRRRGPGGGGGPGGRGGGGFGRGEKPTEVQQFVLMALDRRSGKTLWQGTIREEVPHEGHHRDHGFASHSPVTDGAHVYGWFGSRGLHCYTVDGKPVWQKELGRLQTANGFGEGNSPALHGDTLVVLWDHEGEDFIVAFDKTTGKERWRTAREERTTWTTPLIVEIDGTTQVIASATQRIRSYDLATGKQLWECGGMTANVIPTPIAAFGHLYAISGFRGASLLAIKLGGSGDLTDSPSVTWRHAKSTPYVPSPLLSGDRLYFLSGNNAILSCLGAKDGQVHYTEQRLEGPTGFYASPVAADGRVYLAGRNGVTVVLKDDAKFEVLATNTLDDKFDASPALVGDQLFLRGQTHLYCLAEKK